MLQVVWMASPHHQRHTHTHKDPKPKLHPTRSLGAYIQLNDTNAPLTAAFHLWHPLLPQCIELYCTHILHPCSASMLILLKHKLQLAFFLSSSKHKSGLRVLKQECLWPKNTWPQVWGTRHRREIQQKDWYQTVKKVNSHNSWKAQIAAGFMVNIFNICWYQKRTEDNFQEVFQIASRTMLSLVVTSS